MKHHTPLLPIKKAMTAAMLAATFAVVPAAESQVINCIKSQNATWSDAQSWTEDSVPSQEGETAIINGGLSVTVDAPFEAPIHVKVGNGTTPPPDGSLLITSDFQVTNLSVGVAAQSSGRVEQNAGKVYVQELSLASLAPEPIEATYDLVGGSLSAEILTVGTMGPATLSMSGTGEVVSAPSKLMAGPQSTLRFVGTKDGFPSLGAPGEVAIEPGAVLTVVSPGPNLKRGKFTIIKARAPLADKFSVELSGFDAGKAELLTQEDGVVLEVR